MFGKKFSSTQVLHSSYQLGHDFCAGKRCLPLWILASIIIIIIIHRGPEVGREKQKYSQRFHSSFKERFADSIIFLNYFAYHEIYMEDSFLTLRKYEGTSES